MATHVHPNGGIDDAGNLYIERAGKNRDQYCPMGSGSSCGDQCPLFGEPVMPELDEEGKQKNSEDSVILNICLKTVLMFENFADDRRVTSEEVGEYWA